MVGSIASSPAVDLSTLPPPELAPLPDFATRRAAKLARLVELHAEFTALVESDPAVKLIEADSYDELVLTQAFNDAGKQLLLAYAEGANLDHLGANMDCSRLVVTPATGTTAAVMESDTAYRRRLQLAPHQFSVAGPELAYKFHALSADGDVADATAISPSPGEVVITVLSRSGSGLPSAAVIAAVETVLTGPVRPLTDHVTVQPATLVDYAIVARIYPFAGPDGGLILQTALDRLNAYLAKARKLGWDVPRSAIYAALQVDGVVQRVELDSPPVDVAISPYQVGNPTAVQVTIGGTEL